MRLGWDDVQDGVKSVLSGLSWLLAAMMPVTFAVLLRAWSRRMAKTQRAV
jgi:hypothetical protein